ncbi:acyltransferase family protein [Microbacterium sp. nov. GSS16]|uniref:acyltransferase family protein n=1 Tax=Microbacterium sp. nov. GSS16 TaxID=3019890 RepID=UPI002305D69D|nr:acyltransferase family protein [Microbacterium sp. nov. GSS16]WCD92532.1 acyltransferase family protein [Microbacterium sp. nov. GSS16]
MNLNPLRGRDNAPDATTAPGYRADIDGLRALAILLVVVYHVWLGRVSGGVDVFLMVSAFFLTASFVRRVRSDRPLELGAFWLRRFRRLLPAAAVTIAGVLAVAFLSYPETEWPRVWSEGWSSLFYVENWTLAFSEVDYYARDSVRPSPFQHFWSLSVQGQVFVLWPLIVAAVWLFLRKRRYAIIPALALVFSAIFVGSLAFSIIETAHAQSFAYFDTRTRLWEFAAGSLVALALPFVRIPRWSAAILGWVGVFGIVLCGVVLDVQGGFPGYLALWPVGCTALVIIAGVDRVRSGPSAFLESAALRYVSRDAYALYLVHWPVLVTWMVLSGRSQPGWLAGLGIVGLSFILARLVSALVEQPIRVAPAFDRLPRLGAMVLVASVAVVAVPLGAWQLAIKQKETTLMASESAGYPGAAQVDGPVDLAGVDLPLRPLPTALDDEWVDLGLSCSGPLEPTDSALRGSCVQTPGAQDPATTRVLVMGDSHAQQLMSPLVTLADEQEWELISLLKGGCSIGIGAPSWSGSGPPCDEWRVAAVDYALRIQPDAVYLVVTRATPASPEVLVEGIDVVIDALTAQGIEVIAVRDNPRFDFNMYECALAESEAVPGENPAPCGVPEVALESGNALNAIVENPGVTLVDFRPWLCPDGVCRGIIGNIAVYIDDNHLSSTYGRTLAPMLKRMLEAGERLDVNAA